MDYQKMLETQAKEYNTTTERMDIANRAFANSDDYECILLDVYMMIANLNPQNKAEYLTIVAQLSDEDFVAIINGTHNLVQ